MGREVSVSCHAPTRRPKLYRKEVHRLCALTTTFNACVASQGPIPHDVGNLVGKLRRLGRSVYPAQIWLWGASGP